MTLVFHIENFKSDSIVRYLSLQWLFCIKAIWLFSKHNEKKKTGKQQQKRTLPFGIDVAWLFSVQVEKSNKKNKEEQEIELK